MVNKYYEELYEADKMISDTEGDSYIYYRAPKTIDLFMNRFPALENYSLLELGTGEGRIFELILGWDDKFGSYTLTDASPSAVRKLKDKYSALNNIILKELDVTSTFPFPDNTFDIVCCFGVMHHITPLSIAQHMANEMVRVSKKFIFLTEANGLSIIRRIGELPKKARELGESSYTPWRYKTFFKNAGVKFIKVTPFYFFVPPNVKKDNLKPFITISEIGARIPLLKWQSQALEIYCEKS